MTNEAEAKRTSVYWVDNSGDYEIGQEIMAPEECEVGVIVEIIDRISVLVEWK